MERMDNMVGHLFIKQIHTVKLFTFSFEIGAPNIISRAPKIFSCAPKISAAHLKIYIW